VSCVSPPDDVIAYQLLLLLSCCCCWNADCLSLSAARDTAAVFGASDKLYIVHCRITKLVAVSRFNNSPADDVLWQRRLTLTVTDS